MTSPRPKPRALSPRAGSGGGLFSGGRPEAASGGAADDSGGGPLPSQLDLRGVQAQLESLNRSANLFWM